MKIYEVITVQCKWWSEEKGGFTSIVDNKRFEDHVAEFCNANNCVPIGGASVTPWGTTLLVSQTVTDKSV